MNLAESILNTKAKGHIPVIAEIKRVIPRLAERGRPRDERPAASLASMYEEGGAAGISLVTEKQHFGGQPEIDIPAVLGNTSLPLLIKDFNRDRGQIDFYAQLVNRLGREHLSMVTLLLTAHWLGEMLTVMLDYVHAAGMLALVETRNPADCIFLEGTGQKSRLIGINNKDIDDLEKGSDRIRLTPGCVVRYRHMAPGALLISQSAHKSANDVRRSIGAGADAVLVGTAFMVSRKPAEIVSNFVHSQRA